MAMICQINKLMCQSDCDQYGIKCMDEQFWEGDREKKCSQTDMEMSYRNDRWLEEAFQIYDVYYAPRKYLIWATSANNGFVVDESEELVPFLQEVGVLLFPLLSKGPGENLILHLFFILLYVIGQVTEYKA